MPEVNGESLADRLKRVGEAQQKVTDAARQAAADAKVPTPEQQPPRAQEKPGETRNG